MAKVIANEEIVVVRPWWDKLHIVFTGAGLGLVWWVIASLLKRYVIEPLACRNLSSADACMASFGIAGDIALIAVSILGAYVLMRALRPRPIIIAVASAVVLWGLAGLMAGLAWYEALLWAVGLFAATYTLFSLIGRIRSLGIAIIVAVVVAVALRILAAL